MQQLAAVARQTMDGIALIAADGRIEWVNATYERLTGYRLADIRGRRGRDFLTGPLTDPQAASTITYSYEARRPVRIEIQHCTRQGVPVWFEVRSNAYYESSGTHLGFVQTRFDIGERKAAEAAAAAALADQLRGYPAARALGPLSQQLLNPGASAEAIERLLEGVRSGVAEMKRMQHRRADGRWIDVDASHAPRHDDSAQLAGRITLVPDVTAQLRAQQAIEEARATAEQAQAAMSTFLSKMSYELRTPLHATLSWARLGRERIDRGAAEKGRLHLQRIEQNGDRLLGLLNDLPDLSRPDAGRMPLNAGRHELAACVERVMAEMGGLARACNLHIERPGLAISRELVRAHGGQIGAEDNPGGGTRFVFTLPQDDRGALPRGQSGPAALPAT